ncbi:MAG: cyclic nucleotide-binding domain-containing protein [Verrucomicrobiae bacterium]|nr:cyclic nucleotide-binding domain-containing protein [Verrucomicrobiae bacterium]
MAVSIRNAEERDLEALRGLLAQGSADLAAALEGDAARALLDESTFVIVTEGIPSGRPLGTITVLMQQETAQTVTGVLTRFATLEVPERAEIAAGLVATAIASLADNLQNCFAEIPSSALWAQAACEQAGFVPCGFLPAKNAGDPRGNAIVYQYLCPPARNARRSHPEVVEGAKDLAVESLRAHRIIEDIGVREDATGYPSECDYTAAPLDLETVATILGARPEQEGEVFAHHQLTSTRLHLPAVPAFLAARDGDRVIGLLGYVHDPTDRRVQITEMLALEGEPLGFLLSRLIEDFGARGDADYLGAIVSARAPRLQKTFDQAGFAPCAYLPAFGMENDRRSDALMMVRLFASYESDPSPMTSAAKSLFVRVDTVFREYGVGAAVIKLLRDLRCFRGLGEGEIRRVARIFSQKLYRPNETIFEQDSTGRELYVVERGEIEARAKDGRVLGKIQNGGVLGEIGFLNGEPRTAGAVAKTATIVRVVARTDFDRLIRREPHLGHIFFKNVALDLAEKLSHTVKSSK